MKTMVRRVAAVLLALVLCVCELRFPEKAQAAEGEYPTLVLGKETKAVISEPDGYQYFKFVPSETGMYTFSSQGTQRQSVAYLYDENFHDLQFACAPSHYDGFVLPYRLTAGNVYYFAAGYNYGSDFGSYSVVVKRENPSGVCGDNCTWKLRDDGTLVISGSGDMYDYESKESYGTVDGTTAPWDGWDTISTVEVQKGVTSIGEYAFTMMDISYVELADTVTSIGTYAFYDCWWLSTVKMPATLESVGEAAFAMTTSLLDITIPEGVEKIEYAAFWYSGIRNIWLPASLNEISERAFYNSSSITCVYYAGTEEQWSAITIGETGNENLTSADIRCSAGTFTGGLSGECGYNAYWTLDSDGTLTISGTGGMKDYAISTNSNARLSLSVFSPSMIANTPWFDYVPYIRKIVVEEGITHIGNNAFYNCYKVQDVSLPDTLYSVGNAAFHYASSIRSIVLPDSINKLGNALFNSCWELSEVDLPDSLTVLSGGLFATCNKLKNLELPEGLKTIAADALPDEISDITIPSSVTKLESLGGLSNSYDLTVRFKGAVPSGLKDYELLKYTRYVQCEEEYYEDYKALIVQGIQKMADRNSQSIGIRLESLYTGETPVQMDKEYATLDEANPLVRLSVSERGTTGELNAEWSVFNRDIATVSGDGLVKMNGTTGSAIAVAEVETSSGRSMTFCCIATRTTKHNDQLLATLPTRGIKDNLIATSSTTLGSMYGGISGYRPRLYVETDTSKAGYQALLNLTNSLTAGCSNDTEKTKAIFKWIGSNITWSLASLCIGETPDQAYAVYYNREGNCQGFSKLAGFMLSIAGVPSGIISNSGHMWNVVYLDGEWKMLDAQYGSGAFGADYSDSSYSEISNIIFAQGEYIFVVDKAGEIKLAGVGISEAEENREHIETLEIPSWTDTIFGEAVSYCPNLTKVTIPSGVTNIASMAFEDCPKLTTICCVRGSYAETWALENGYTVEYVTEANTLFLPNGLTEIAAGAFADLPDVYKIVIPETVSAIGEGAFEGTDAVLYVVRGSFAEQWAEENGMEYTAE